MRWAFISLRRRRPVVGLLVTGAPRVPPDVCIPGLCEPRGWGKKVAGREGRPQAAPKRGSLDASFLGPAPPSGLTSGT